MARQRSPNYPAWGLAAAIKDADALYRKEQRARVDQDIAVRAWGFRGLSGGARTRLGAVKQYGLVEGSGKQVQVTDRAITILLRQPESREWQAAVKAAALEPDIFRDLYERFPDQGSDDAIRAHLVRERNFTSAGAEKLISAYRATVEFAKLSEGAYTPSAEQVRDSGDEDDEMSGDNGGDGTTSQLWSWPLSPTVMAQVKLTGRGISADDLDTLADYLAVAKKALERQAKADSGTTGD